MTSGRETCAPDRTGRNIAERIKEELVSRCVGTELYVDRVAVTERQIAHYCLPTRPTRTSRRQTPTRYEATHGAVSVELDAFPPNEVREIVAEVIERHMDPWTLQTMRMVERARGDRTRGSCRDTLDLPKVFQSVWV